MNRLKKTSTAVLVLLLAAVLSVLGGGGMKLHKARAAAELAFYDGKAGFSVYNDLMELRETSYNLLRISEGTGSAEAEQRTVAAAWAQLDEADTPEKYAAACAQLTEAIQALDAALEIGDEALRTSWERQLRSYTEYLSHLRFDSYYDEKAADYNRLFDDPLAALIGRLSGSGEMPRFTETR